MFPLILFFKSSFVTGDFLKHKSKVEDIFGGECQLYITQKRVTKAVIWYEKELKCLKISNFYSFVSYIDGSFVFRE